MNESVNVKPVLVTLEQPGTLCIRQNLSPHPGTHNSTPNDMSYSESTRKDGFYNKGFKANRNSAFLGPSKNANYTT